MTDFDELMERVKSLTGLEGRDAAQVAFGLDDNPRPQEIIEKALELGFDVEKLHGQTARETNAPLGSGISMDPAVVLTEVFLVVPTCMPVRLDDEGEAIPLEIPVMGRAPEEAERHESIAEMLADLPEDIRAMLVKIDLLEGAATFWVRDAANEIDRPIGPIDITNYSSGEELTEAFMDLLKRIGRVLAAGWN